MAKSIARNLADVASPTGVLDGTLSTAAQTNITSVGTLSSLVIADGGNIGAASDTDAISISSGGVVTMNQIPVLSAGLNVSGGTIAGTLSTAAQGNITSLGTLTALTIDDITINGSTISDGATIAIDSGGNIELDADGGQVIFADGGTNIGRLENSSSDFVIKSMVNDKDIIFKGEDGGSPVTALTLSMSGAGAATFNSTVTATTFIGALTGNVTGNVSGTAATVTGAAQTNITSLGTLSSLAVTGTVTGGDGTFTNLTIGAAEKLRLDGAGGHTFIQESSNDTMVFATGNSTRLTLDANATFTGNVGIGNNNPGFKLTVGGGIGANQSTAYASMTGQLGFGNDYSDTQRGPNKIVLQNDGSWIAGLGISNGSTDFYSGGHFTFRTGTSLGSERMRIDSNGQVGIGKSPIRMLDIKDYGSGDPGIRLESASYSQDVITLRNGDGRVGFGGDAITVLQSGNVGVGHSGPASKLDVRDTATATVPLRLETAGGAANTVRPQISMYSQGSNGYHISTIRSNLSNDPYGLVFTENTTERMRIDSSGRLEMPVLDLRSTSYNHFRGNSSGVNSIGGGAVSHGRMRQFTFQQAMNANATVHLLQNQSAHTDVHIQYWIECFHSSRTYRMGHATWGGYGLYTSSAGHGLDLVITAVSSGIKKLSFTAAGLATTAYIAMWIYGDSGITVLNGTLADQI